jgi:hypothetical protein
MINYDSTHVGVPYIRADKITILWPANGGTPAATVEQSLAVKMADGSVRTLEPAQTLSVNLDFMAHGTEAIPLVDPTSGAALGQNTNLNMVMLQILAAIRIQQLALNT